jgi:hypothetical protein
VFAGALQAEPEPWYQISGSEVQSIERYLARSEQERQGWLLQAGELRTCAESLNAQLAEAREAQRRLEKSFNGYEAEWLARMSQRDGEIAAMRLEAEKNRGRARNRLTIIIALGAAWGMYIAYKARRVFGIGR